MKSFDRSATVKVKLGDAFGSNVEMAALKHVPQQPPWGCIAVPTLNGSQQNCLHESLCLYKKFIFTYID